MVKLLRHIPTKFGAKMLFQRTPFDWQLRIDIPKFEAVSVKRRLQTADCRLQTGGKMQTEGKMQTADQG